MKCKFLSICGTEILKKCCFNDGVWNDPRQKYFAGRPAGPGTICEWLLKIQNLAELDKEMMK